MKNKDLAIRSKIESLLQSDFPGQGLKAYFDQLPDHQVRRAITLLSGVYPDKTVVLDDECMFIAGVLSDKRYLAQESFFMFISALNIIDFTEKQKNVLTHVIKIHMETLCQNCTFELDHLLMKLFAPYELFEYMKVLVSVDNTAVLEHIRDILCDKVFFSRAVSGKALEQLKRNVSQKLCE